ncbi:Plant calmodulin-binding domain [Musa troglodytarum]|uniref:Plant calmodulin-binding domain n=1 Tax=Musa troglodytarum TaxID=320322 RepID=A0A9E7I6E2_9LILI|nr:Plant calmodulin-binding domain [Musa troglodytarum]
MTKKVMDTRAISVNPETKGDGRISSTGELSTGGSLVSSTSSEKPLPNYLRASTSSCHDFCKYGRKHDFGAEAKHPFLLKSGKKLTLREESRQVNSVNVEERRKRLMTNPKSSSHQRAEFPDNTAVSKQKAASKIKEVRLPEQHVDMKSQISSSIQKSSISSDSEGPPTSQIGETQASMNIGDQKMKQVLESKTLSKSQSFSSRLKVGEQMGTSLGNGIDGSQKSGTIKRNISSPLQEATSSTKPRLIRQTSSKSDITHDGPQKIGQKPLVHNEVTQVAAKHVTSKKATKSPTEGSGSSLTASHGPIEQRNKKALYDKSREITRTLERKMLKPSTASLSLKHTGDEISSSKLSKYKNGKQTVSLKNQKVGNNAELVTRNNEKKTLCVIDKTPEKVDMDSAEQNSSKVENIVYDLSEQPLSKYEDIDSDSLQETSLKPDNSDTAVLGHKLLEPENISAASLELRPDDKKKFQVKNADMDFLEQRSLSPENTDFDSLGMIPDDKKWLEPENADMNSLGENMLKPEENGFESSVKPIEQELHGPKSADTDSLEQELLKLEDIDLDSLDVQNLLEQGDADKDFLGQKLLKPENIDLDSLELKPNDDQSSQLGSDDEEIEEVESASSKSSESESVNEPSKDVQKRRTRMDAVVHPEDKLSTPQKLKFRRGKIIELQPECKGLRRLRFRRGRLMSKSADDGQVERMNFQRSEMGAPVSDPSPESKGVVLKHQDTQEKKDIQGLFNNVIEETASKLVESRRSKVKALVGAFETVISLQDSKPASTG